MSDPSGVPIVVEKPLWRRSLYWRVALGLFAFLALMVTAQSVLFIWIADRIAGSMPAGSPRRLAALVAADMSSELAASPDLDVSRYISDQFGGVIQPFVVVMRDGRVASNQTPIPEGLEAAVTFERARLAQVNDRPPQGDGRRGGRGGPIDRTWEGAPIIVDGRLVGAVAVLDGPPSLGGIARALGPGLAAIAATVLALGMTLVSSFVFGPARRRLLQLQHATYRLGAGDLTARAPVAGGDEVSAVAASFNRMADELAARAAALDASDRARRQLLADVSHELLTPLTAMRGYVETLSMRELALDQATADRYLQIIDTESQRLERIVGDLLDLARLEGSGQAFARAPVPLADLFARVRERHERESQARGIQIVSAIAPDAAVVMGDGSRLEQALQNLAANALRHTPDGGQVAMNATAAGDTIRITVRDTGTGIPDEHLPLIFDRFYKADASRRAAGGSGLGLSIVRAIVERHNGTVTARNDGGAVFEVVLPGYKASSAEG